MKIEITPEYDPRFPPGLFYTAWINGQKIVAAGATWDEAKKRMIAALEEYTDKPPLPPKEVIDV